MIEQFPSPAKKSLGLIFGLVTLFFLLSLLFSSQAPHSTFTTITGKKITMAQLRGKPVLITFWATDCLSCLKEIPDLMNLYSHYHDLGLEIIAIAMNYDPPSRVVAMTHAKQIPYDVVLDLKSEHAQAFGPVQFTPSTFLVSPQGLIVMKKIGVFDPVAMKTQIEKLLKG